MNSLARFAHSILGLRRSYRAAKRLLGEALEVEALRERFPQLTLGQGVIVKGVDKFSPGKDVFIDQRAYLSCRGTEWNDFQGHINTGDRVEIGPFCVLWGAGGITLGSNVHLASHVTLMSHTALQIAPETTDIWAPMKQIFKPIVIEDNVIVGLHAIVGPGVRIGHHAQIGGGAVVLSDVPPYALAVGAPARVVRYSNGAPVNAATPPQSGPTLTSRDEKVVDVAR